MKDLKEGLELIAEERKRQIEVEGFLTDDEDYHEGQLLKAALAYHYNDVSLWPWDLKWWKPTPNDPVRQMVKSGALFQAEADRLNTIISNPNDIRNNSGTHSGYDTSLWMVQVVSDRIDLFNSINK